jgi:GMP synthase (glutamine-hydrolysing)
LSATDDTVLVVDFGAQYARLIARRVREAHVYSEIVPHTMPAAEMVARKPVGIILSGGPKSVYETPSPDVDPAIYDAGIPILGICYGAQLMVRQLGGTVAHTGRGEYGRTALSLTGGSALFTDWPSETQVWMSHGDSITEAPPGFTAFAASAEAPVAAFGDPDRRLYGVQFHPEVVHTERGAEFLERFLLDVCGASTTWTHVSIIEAQVAAVRAQVGTDRVLCALSGGVDSAGAPPPGPNAPGAPPPTRSPPPWSTRPSATSSPACSSTPGSCAPGRPSRSRRPSGASSTSTWST